MGFLVRVSWFSASSQLIIGKSCNCKFCLVSRFLFLSLCSTLNIGVVDTSQSKHFLPSEAFFYFRWPSLEIDQSGRVSLALAGESVFCRLSVLINFRFQELLIDLICSSLARCVKTRLSRSDIQLHGSDSGASWLQLVSVFATSKRVAFNLS